MWDALVVQASRDGEWWRLPFPAGFGGGDAKDFLAWLAPYAALATLALAAFRVRRVAGLVVLGAGAAIYYVSRADLEHAQALLIVTAALAALVRPKVVGAAVLALLIAVGAGNRASALLRPPDLAPLVDGVRVPPADAAAIPRVVALVHELVPPGEPIYVAPRRSDLVDILQSAAALLGRSAKRAPPRRAAAGQTGRAGQDRRRAPARAAARHRALDGRGVRAPRAEPARAAERLDARSTTTSTRAYRLEARFGDYEVLVAR